MGLYIISDAYKLSWIETVFGEKNTATLYKGGGNLSLHTSANSSQNENDNITDHTEFINLLKSIDSAETSSDIESIFDIDQFLTEMALDYLFGGWDHIQTGHNYYMYKPIDGKWKYFSYDFDHDFGQSSYGINKPFYEIIPHHHIFELLIINDSKRFDEIVKNLVDKVFNPSTLFPRIDELKEFIRPYVILDKTPDEEGNYPGHINYSSSDEFISLDIWDANTEFTTVYVNSSVSYGLKYWILEKYRFVCDFYKLECDSVYINKNYSYSVNEELEYHDNNGNDDDDPSFDEHSTSNIVTTQSPKQTIQKVTSTQIPETPVPSNTSLTCWSELIGFPCCPSNQTIVYAHDDYGDWGYDFHKKEWCGLTPFNESSPTDDVNCWSKKYGYPCCMGCVIYEKDNYGAWGYEFNQWCGIPSYC